MHGILSYFGPHYNGTQLYLSIKSLQFIWRWNLCEPGSLIFKWAAQTSLNYITRYHDTGMRVSFSNNSGNLWSRYNFYNIFVQNVKTLHNFYWFQDFLGPEKSGNQEKSGKLSCLMVVASAMVTKQHAPLTNWTLLTLTTRTYLFCIVNIMVADSLAMQGAMASATIILT